MYGYGKIEEQIMEIESSGKSYLKLHNVKCNTKMCKIKRVLK